MKPGDGKLFKTAILGLLYVATAETSALFTDTNPMGFSKIKSNQNERGHLSGFFYISSHHFYTN